MNGDATGDDRTRSADGTRSVGRTRSVVEALQREAQDPTHADFTAPRTVHWFVPGRIEILGKHTDYAGGRSLLAAVDLGLSIRAVGRADRVLEVRSEDVDDTVVMDLDSPQRPVGPGAGHWGGYVRTVVDRLEANFRGRLRGAEITITSTLPLAAGMSSSSALVTGITLVLLDLAAVADEEPFLTAIADDEQLAEYFGCIENGQTYGTLEGRRGVGTFGGSEDHTAMICGVPDALVQYSFCPVRPERIVPFPDDLALVVAVSGVDAEKTGAAREDYNRVSLAVGEILSRWNDDRDRDDPTLAAAVATGPASVEHLKHLAADDGDGRPADDDGRSAGGGRLADRLAQFLDESERIVPAAAIALEDGDLAELGRLVDESQRGAEDLLGNQTPETIALQRLARDLGAHAASSFGAGFGGSVWALVDASSSSDAAESFAAEWLAAYRERFPDAGARASVLVTRPGPAAHRLDER